MLIEPCDMQFPSWTITYVRQTHVCLTLLRRLPSVLMWRDDWSLIDVTRNRRPNIKTKTKLDEIEKTCSLYSIVRRDWGEGALSLRISTFWPVQIH